VSVPFAPSVGGGSAYQNVGSVTNRGLEGLANLRLIDRSVIALDLNMNVSANTNKLDKVNPNAPPGYFQNNGFTAQRHRVGYPLYGLWQKPILSYNDANNDGILLANEIVVGDTEVYVGPSAPTRQISYGGSLALWRDRLRLATVFDYHGGFQRLDYRAWVGCALSLDCAGSVVRGTETMAEQAAIQAYGKANTNMGFIDDGAFTRLREASITADLPREGLRWLRASSGSVTLSGRNLKMWTKWRGGDPEVNSGADAIVTFPTPPQARTFIARVNLGW
jgi:TonB-dependent starch-binding outer membrane protein SusC